MGQRVAPDKERENMQKAIDSLSDWADKLGMEFMLENVKLLYIELGKTKVEREFGVAVLRTPCPPCSALRRPEQPVWHCCS
jgi:hypothetical protein